MDIPFLFNHNTNTYQRYVDTYALKLFVNKINSYEPGLVSIIKLFLHPYIHEYKFAIGDLAKYIYYEMSYHSHFSNKNSTDYMNSHEYCACYYNRKHNKEPLKRHRVVKLIRILDFLYDTINYKKQYKCSHSDNFESITYLYEDDISKLTEY